MLVLAVEWLTDLPLEFLLCLLVQIGSTPKDRIRFVRSGIIVHRVTSVLVSTIFLCGLSYSRGGVRPSSPPDSSIISASRLAVCGGIFAASGVAVHFARYKPLWNEHFTSFHFHEDFTYAQNQDKLLHFYGGVVGSAISSKALFWSGYSPPEASILGGVTSLAFLTFMKIEDGYINYLGFDRVDELSNLAGAAYPLAQYYVPFLNSFTPKMSFVASKNNVVAKNQALPNFLEDHEGQKFWMGITVYDMLPKQLQRYWIPAIGVAVGYTVRDLNTPKPYHETIIALDLDLRKLPGNSQLLRTMWEMLNYIHLPMPAVRISPSVIWYGVYF